MCQTTYKKERFTKDGKAMHTCNGDVISGLPFGKKAPEGTCRRCDELRNGATPRQSAQSIKQAEEAKKLAAIRSHKWGFMDTTFDW